MLLAPSVGRPHNQLGTLAGATAHGLQAAYHYLRCMTCDEPFDGGLVNLRKLLEKNHNRRVRSAGGGRRRGEMEEVGAGSNWVNAGLFGTICVVWYRL